MWLVETRRKEERFMAVTVRELVRTGRPTYLSPFEEAERLFDSWLRPMSRMAAWPLEIATFEPAFPRVDMFEKGDELIVKADLPGMKKDDVEVNLSDNLLTISGETKTEEKVEKGDFYACERSTGSFRRTFELPYDVDGSKTTAHFENGVLEIRLSKTHRVEGEPKKIEITA